MRDEGTHADPLSCSPSTAGRVFSNRSRAAAIQSRVVVDVCILYYAYSVNESGHVYYLKQKDVLILFAEGHIQALTAYSMFEHVSEVVSQNGITGVFLDLSKTEYIDSTTIGTMLKLNRFMAQHDGKTWFCNPSKSVANILKTCHLYGYLPIVFESSLEQLRTDVLDHVPVQRKDLLTDDYVLEAHKDIVEASPQVRPKFEALLSVLEKKVHGEKS